MGAIVLLKFRTEVVDPAVNSTIYIGMVCVCVLGSHQVKVTVCGEDKAHLPIKAQSATRALNTRFIQLVPGSKDVEGRQVS